MDFLYRMIEFDDVIEKFQPLMIENCNK